MARRKDESNPFVGIAGALGGILVAIVAIVMVFASSQAWVLAPISAAVAVMAVFLGFFASKRR